MSPQVEEYFKFTCEYIKIYGPKTIALYLSGDWYEVYAVVCNDGSYAVVDTDGTYFPSCIQDIHHYLNADIFCSLHQQKKFVNKQLILLKKFAVGI